MRKTPVALLVLAATSSVNADVRPHGAMMRFPDVGKTHIVFVYANDLWLTPREGGVALPLASPPGMETHPKFSPDGQTIAFVGNYDGNRDLYTIPVAGGVATRVTHHPSTETLCDWAPETGSAGSGRLIYFTNGLAGRNRIVQLFTVAAKGGLPEQMPVPYGANASVSPDGEWLAYTPHTIDNRTWKRYRGGMATDVWLFNLKNNTSKQITDWEGTDTLPMWHGTTVYYLSDAGPEHRLNVWSYDTKTGQRKQVTNFAEFDVKWPSVGPGDKGQGEIVFQLGADLRLLDLKTGQSRVVEVTVPGDRPKVRTQVVDAAKFIEGADISPSAKRVAVEARGDIWTLPAEKGAARNLTRTPGVAERDPSWSPDGRWIAYFSDASGEYELYVMQSDGRGEARRLTRDGAVFRLSPQWSPDSKRVVFYDKTGSMYVHTVGEGDGTGETSLIEKDPWSGDGTGLWTSWSHDSRWIAYHLSRPETPYREIWVYEPATGQKKQLTSGFFDDQKPTFDRRGDFLFYTSSRSFRPWYGEVDTSFVYANTETLVALPLRKDVKSPWAPESDEEDWKALAKKKEEKKDGEGKDGEKKDGAEEGEKKDENGKNGEKKENGKDDGVTGVWEGTLTGPEPLPPGGAAFTLTVSVGKDNAVAGSFSTMGETGTVKGTWDPSGKTLDLAIALPDGSEVTGVLSLAGGSLSGTLTHNAMAISASLSGKRTSTAVASAGGDKKDDGKPREKVDIDFEGAEQRAIVLPIKPGVFGRLGVNDKNELLFVRRPAQGMEEPAAAIKLFSLKDEKKEEKQVAAGQTFALTADGKKMLVMKDRALSIQDASAGATGKPVPTAGMNVFIEPRAEWRQMFTEAWRVQRDYFYEPTLHGVDWPKMRDRYAAMLQDCASREDLSYVISEMISELNVGHAYYRGGAVEDEPSMNVGLLGCDFELRDGAYRISRILRGASWDADAKSPLAQPGLEVKEGQYLLAVNGAPVDTARDPWAALLGLAGKPVVITVSDKPTLDDSAKDVVVEPISDETNLRYRAWVEERRAYVAQKTGGKAGYIYVPSTGIDGQNELVRQFYGQAHLPGLVIDDRWNSGGQIPTRFIELLNRPTTNYWARRDGMDWRWPPDSHQGPKCMLVNGLAGSGGDAFPYYFRQAKLGKLIGTRTWGGLVGISGNPGLIDGGGVTAPTFGFYETDGTWGVEGHGVDPDIVVIDDPAKMLRGMEGPGGVGDPQLDAAIAHILKEIADHPHSPPKRPPSPNRAGMGLDKADY